MSKIDQKKLNDLALSLIKEQTKLEAELVLS